MVPLYRIHWLCRHRDKTIAAQHDNGMTPLSATIYASTLRQVESDDVDSCRHHGQLVSARGEKLVYRWATPGPAAKSRASSCRGLMQVVTSVESEGLWGVTSEWSLLRVGVCAAGPGGMKMQMQNAGCEEEMREISRQIRGYACRCCGEGAR